jgi:hypothetical protein
MVLLAAALCGAGSAAAQSVDPPGRVGRVSDLTGPVSLQLAGESEWRSAYLNYPLTSGDALWTDAGARSEVHIGSSAVHLAEGTSLVFDAIEDNLVQLRIGQGAVHVRLRSLFQGDGYEIDTPEGAVVLRAAGYYRVDVTPDGRRTTVTVRNGDADVIVANTVYPVRPGSSVTLTDAGSPPKADDRAMEPDEWERWADMRDRREDAATATRYVPREMIGYEDLEGFGDWQVDVRYGPTWYPRAMPVGWAPYRTGRWVWVRPWGWTWIDEAPWGFAPFHYGRWAYMRGRWAWLPGRMYERPVYAPALVAFVSGSGWGASLSFGPNGGVGWIPLGPEEVYVPAYRASPVYVRKINVTNINARRVDATRVDVTRVRYVNRNVQGAVTVVRRDDFMGSRPVGRTSVPVRPADLAGGRVSRAPIAAGAAIEPPKRGSPLDQGRPDNAGPVRQPPHELPRLPNRRDGRGRGEQAVPAAPVPEVLKPAPAGDGRRTEQPVTRQPAVVPPAAAPAAPQDRNRARPTQPTMPERKPPARQPAAPAPRPPAAAPVSPPAAAPAAQPAPGQAPARGRARPTQPASPAVRPPAQAPAAPPAAAPATPPTRGRATPARPAAPPAAGRGRTTPPDSGRAKPARPRADSGRGSGKP